MASSPSSQVDSSSEDEQEMEQPISSTPHAAAPAVASTPSAMTPSKGKRALEAKREKKKKKKKKKSAADVDVGGEDGENDNETVNKSASPLAAEGEDEKKNVFQRVYSFEDEIVILKGMLSLRNKGKNPTTHVDELLDNIKGYLSCEVDKLKLSSKITTLKKKYMKNLKKGENLFFSRPHDEHVHQLAKKVWRENVPAGKAEGGNDSLALARNKDDLSMYPSLDALAYDRKDYGAAKHLFSERRLSLLPSSKKDFLDRKWKKIQEEEAALLLKKTELFKETYNEVRNAQFS